jgi:hypothetical protein
VNEQVKISRRSRADIAARYVGGGSLIFTSLTWMVFMVAQAHPIDFAIQTLLVYIWYLQIAVLVVGVALASLASLCWRRFCCSPSVACVYFTAVFCACFQYVALSRMPIQLGTVP